MASDDYSGAIDWDRIYLTCHGADAIAARLAELLGPQDGSTNAPVLFAGFAATAARLAETHPVTFVDLSPVVVAQSRARYGALGEVVEADILDALERSDAPDVIISGRLSAFWDDPDHFETLALALCAAPRRRVVIDFFDRACAVSGQTVTFGGGAARGQWRFLRTHRHADGPPSVCRVDHAIRYDLGEDLIESEAQRSFFDASQIALWARARLPGLSVHLHPPLFEGDPSFALVLSA